MAEKEPKELKGKGGRDAAAYKSETGGAGMGGKKMDKLAGSCGADCKPKDEGAYKAAKLQD
jgi:hypothetical protein